MTDKNRLAVWSAVYAYVVASLGTAIMDPPVSVWLWQAVAVPAVVGFAGWMYAHSQEL